MPSHPKPARTRARGLVLTEEALKRLDEALRQWWANAEARKASKTGKLSREAKAEGLGLTVNTVDRIYRREPVDEITLRTAFENLNVLPPFSKDQDCVPASLPSGNLPNMPAACIGRKTEIAEIQALLKSGSLVTLTGTGGVGKTRLAMEVAQEMQRDFAAGVWLVELAEVADPALVVQRVATTLGVQEQTQAPLLQTLTDFLRGKALLLVLDNCEHLLEACATLADHLLSVCTRLKVLATSRERLNIRPEHPYRVPSLPAPDRKRLAAEQEKIVQSLLTYDSVRLFVERTAVHRRDFMVTSQNAPRLASICQRLDGIPLAIELAAGRMGALSLDDLERGLNDGFRLLTKGSRAALPRHQTLRATMDWSYQRLTRQEQKLLGRLSVFSGGATLEAAEQVCSGEEIAAWEVLDLLTSLVDKSLVVYEEPGKAVGGRYRLLETVRQYAGGHLQESEEQERVQKRHRDYFLALVEEAEPYLKAGGQVEWLQRLEAEHDNLRAALVWSLAEAGSEAGLRLCGALQRFWSLRGYLSEGRNWCERTLAGTDDQVRTLARAKALNTAGQLDLYLGDYPSAVACNEKALAIQQEIGDAHGVAVSLFNMARTPGAPPQDLFQLLVIWLLTGDWHGIAAALSLLGLVACCEGDEEYGMECQIAGLAIKRNIGDLHGMGASLNNLGHWATERKDYDTARQYYQESLDIRRKIGDKGGIASTLHNLGFLAYFQNEDAIARSHFVESLCIKQEVGNKLGIRHSLGGFAVLAARANQWERAATLWGADEALREECDMALTPHEQEQHEHDLAQLREALSEELLSTAWERGRAMNLEQAIAYALEETGE